MVDSTPKERSEQSLRLNANLFGLLAKEAPRLPRYSLVASAASLSHEHHSSICKLVQTSHYAGAAALMRPLFEASVTAAWSLYAATVDQVTGVLWGTYKLPKPAVMLSRLEARPEIKGKLGLKQFYGGPGQLLHRLTHGDMDQLYRRFGGGFSTKENLATLAIADLFVLLSASLYAVTSFSRDRDLFLKNHTDALVNELRALTGQTLDEWPGWQALPQPTIPLGEIPKELQ